MEEKTNKKLEEINKSLKDTQENQEKVIKQVMETVQDLKRKMQLIKKTQTRDGWIWKIWVKKQELQRQV